MSTSCTCYYVNQVRWGAVHRVFYPKCSFVSEKVNFFLYPVLNRSIFHTVLFHSFSTVWNVPLYKTGRVEKRRFVELDCLVEDVYCYSEHQVTTKNNGCKRWCTRFENSEQCLLAWRAEMWSAKLSEYDSSKQNHRKFSRRHAWPAERQTLSIHKIKEGNVPYIRIFKPT